MATPDFPGQPWRWQPIEPPHYTAGRPGPVRLIVIHRTANSASNEAEASYAARRDDLTSAHLYVEGPTPDDVIQCVRLRDQAHSAHSAANGVGVHLELVAVGQYPDGSLWSRAEWLKHDGLLRNAAEVVAAVALKTGIPVRYLTEREVSARLYGVTGHRECVLAFGQGDHTTCPGPNFPWDVLISYAQGGDDMSTLAEAQIGRMFNYLEAVNNGNDMTADGFHCWTTTRQLAFEKWMVEQSKLLAEIRDAVKASTGGPAARDLAAEIISQLTTKA